MDSGHECDQPEAASFISPDNVDTKPAYIYLRQKNNGFWQTTFSSKLSKIDSDNADANSVIQLINDALYNYFTENYRTVKCQVDKALVLKYKEYSANSLKKALKRLKSVAAPLNKASYVSRLLRAKLNRKSDSSSNSDLIMISTVLKPFGDLLNAL